MTTDNMNNFINLTDDIFISIFILANTLKSSGFSRNYILQCEENMLRKYHRIIKNMKLSFVNASGLYKIA